MSRLRGGLALLGLVIAVPAARAQALPDSTRRQIDAVFREYDRTDSPGCALGIYRGGQILYARGYGMANLELGVAITPRTVFDIGSTAKQFTVFAVSLLAEEGRISFDDPVRKHFPELGPYADGITLRHLVHHTSGLRDYLQLFWLAGYNEADVTTDEDALRLILHQREANFAPNTEWLYSNTGYFLLSELVKRVTGERLRAFADARIFRPLGMRHSHFHDDYRMIVPDRATGYMPQRGGGFAITMSNYQQTGDGAVLTNVEDLLRWDQNFYDGRVGGMRLIESMQVPAVLANGRQLQYAGGLFVAPYRGLPAVRHGGAWAGYRAELYRFPTERTTIACLCNLGTANPSALAERVADVLLADRLAAAAPVSASAPPSQPTPRPAVRADSVALRAWAGSWYAPELETTWRFTVRDTILVAERRGREFGQGRIVGRDSLSLGPLLLVATRDGRRVTGFRVQAGRVRNIAFQRSPM